MVLVQLFFTIPIDISLTTGPLLPTFSPMIQTVMIKPAATAIGVGLFCSIFLFPESTSHVVLSSIKQIVSPITEFVEALRVSIDHAAKPMSLEQLQKAKAAGIASFKNFDNSLGFLPLDVSVCRWNADDIASLKEPLRMLFITWFGLLETQINRTEAKNKILKIMDENEAQEELEKHHKIGHHQLAQQLEFVRLFRDTEDEDLIIKSMAVVQVCADPLLAACKDGIQAIVETLDNVNERKWFNRPSQEVFYNMQQRHSQILENIRMESEAFLSRTMPQVIDPHAHLFDLDGVLNLPQGHGFMPLRGVILGAIFEERIVSFSRALQALLAQIVALEKNRIRQRLWFPTSVRRFSSWVLSQQPTPRIPLAMPDLVQEQKHSEPKHHRKFVGHHKNKANNETTSEAVAEPSTIEKLTTIHLHRGKERNPFGQTLLALTHWFTSTEAMYALRVLVVTVALAIPAAIPSSAGFYDREKGIWALIMAQLGLYPYTADYSWGVITKVIGTVVGGIIGMVAWYIGAGSGQGNPYGIAAIMAPLIAVFMYMRLFGPPVLLQASIITAATTYLTVAYSWIDTHIPSYGEPGVGYNIFWRRTLLVIVGFAASTIVMYFPRPPSASRHYRRVLSRTLSGYQDLYALLVANFITTEHEKPHPNTQTTPTSGMMTALEKITLSTSETLEEILDPIDLLRFEFSSTDFTAAGLSKITKLAMSINFNMFQLFYYGASLPVTFKERCRLLSGAFEEHFVGDFMSVLTLLGSSLETGVALPSVLCAPLMVRAFRVKVRALDHGHGDGALEEREGKGGEATHVRTILGTITRHLLETEEEGFRKYCLVISAMVGLFNAVDEMVLVVKEELGETHVVDIEHWGGGSTAGTARTERL